MGRDHKRRSELLDAMERAVEWYHERLLALARRRTGPRLPALARLRRRRRAPVPPGLGARRLGRPGHVARAPRERPVRLGPRLRQPARPGAGLLPGPRPVPDLRPLRAPGRPRRAHPAAAARARRRPIGPSPSTRTPRSRRSTRSAGRSTRSTGPRRVSSRRARSWCARATPTSSAASRPACRGPSPPAAPRWPRSTSPCCATSPSASCWPTTPTPPGRAPPRGSTSGSASTRSTWWWRTSPAAATPASWPAPTPTALARAVKEARPFLQFRVDRMLEAGDLTTAEGRARAAEAALTAVAEHPDDLVRDQYVMQLADRCRRRPGQAPGAPGVPAGPPSGREAGPAQPGVAGRAPAARLPRGRRRPRWRPMAAGRLGADNGAPTRARARGTQVGRAPTRRCSGPCARGPLHRPRATAGVRRALGARQRARSGGVRVTGGGQPVATRHCRRADAG